MKIGIDISQLAYENTGVANFLKQLVTHLLKIDGDNEYILFYSSFRKNFQLSTFNFQFESKVKLKTFKLPPTLLDLLWNRLHIIPVEWFIGDIDVFISSDWTQPPTKKAKKATIIYDLIIFKYPEETDKKIIAVQKRKLEWVKKEADIIFCISKATKKDAMEVLNVPENKLRVIYPGM